LEHDALVELAKDRMIVISKADKGAAVVVQNIEDYRTKMMGIVNTPGKFQKLKGNVTRTRETRLQNILRSLNSDVEKVVDLNSAKGSRIELKKRRMSDEVYRRVLPCGSRAGVLYGLAKIHKANVPLRPIISAVQTYNYKLAKYLDEILKPKVNQAYMLVDTFDFVNKVSTLDHVKDKYLVSFDVESLFTNIPTLETIDLILKLVYTRNTKYFHNLRREELKQLLIICTTESHFQFNKNYYEQTDGVAMGSPLGPLFANIFMSDFERKHMDKLKQLGVQKWLRYVDDLFATLRCKEDADGILEFLNSQHPKKYHKKTFTGVYLNWTSLTAKRYKIRLIKCLTKRVLRICTTEEDKDQELRKLKLILLRNQYLAEVIDREMDNCIKRHPQRETTQQPPEDTRRKKFIVLPYTNRTCEVFAEQIRNLVNNTFPSIDLNVAYQAPKKIGDFFPYKDKVELPEEQANVVYHLKCTQCEADYIWKTKRILVHSLKEQDKGETSACHRHSLENPCHLMDYENVNVIDQASNDMKLKIKELLTSFRRNQP